MMPTTDGVLAALAAIAVIVFTVLLIVTLAETATGPVLPPEPATSSLWAPGPGPPLEP